MQYIQINMNYLQFLLIMACISVSLHAFQITNTTKPINLADPSEPIISIAITHDASSLAASCLDSRIYIYQRSQHEQSSYEIKQQIVYPQGPLQSIDISESMEYIVAGGVDACLLLYQRGQSKHSLRQKDCRDGNILNVQLIRNSQQVIVGRQGGTIEIYEINEGSLSLKTSLSGGEKLLYLQTIQNGQLLVTGGPQQQAKIYKRNGQSYDRIQTLQGITPRSISISEDEKTIVFSTPERCLLIYQLQNGQYSQIQQICPNISKPDKGFLSQDGQYLVATSNIQKSIYIYKFDTGKNNYELFRTIERNQFIQGINCVAMNPKLSHLVLGIAKSIDGRITDQEPKITVLTKQVSKNDTQTQQSTNQLNSIGLLIAVIVLSCVIVLMMIGFVLYKKLYLDKQVKYRETHDTLGSVSATSYAVDVMADQQLPKQIPGEKVIK